MTKFLSDRKDSKSAPCTKLSANEAAQLITSSHYDEPLLFDDVTAIRLGLSRGALISVAPDDTGMCTASLLAKLISHLLS
jgi:hypothetical protein